MRVRVVAMAASVLLVSCTGGDGAAGRSGLQPSTLAPPTTVPATSGATASSTTTIAGPSAVDPPGSVTLRVAGFTLPPGAGLRVVVAASSPRVILRRQGAGGGLSACPVADAVTPVDPAGCADVGAGRTVDLGAHRGVEIRSGAAGVAVEEVAFSYVPVDRSTTVVIPARPAGACATTACEAAFSLAPAQGGVFTLDGRAGGGRPRLVAEAVTSAGGSRVLATVEGGAALSIRATLEPSAQAVVRYREQAEGPVAALSMDISWP